MNAPAVVIGIGNPLRRDDGVGPAVAADVARLSLPDVQVLSCVPESTAILDAWQGAARAVLIDAALGREPGRVRQCTLSDLIEPTPLSSHDLSLRQTYELGRALGRAPASVVVVSVDIADTGHGAGLTPAVQAALPDAVRLVLDILGAQREESADQQP